MTRREAVTLLAAAAAGSAAPAASPRPMLKRRIPSSGEELPAIGLGTWQTFDTTQSAPLEEVLRTFVQLGGRVVDSSPMYGRSETVLGDLAAKLGLQAKLFVATKVWTSGKQAGIAQMNDSMRKLRVEKLDLMQVHNLVDAHAHLATLAAWKKEGRIRYLGITHYTQGAYDAVARYLAKQPLDFLQINYSVIEREAEQRILPLAKERGVAVIVNRPFGEGSAFRAVRNKPLPAFARELDCTSWAQLFLKFVISHPAVTCAIPATSKVEHLRDNMAAGRGRLPNEQERKRIAEAIG
ncbi:MAG TPA: aldo/keto reductase [Thermoanaerobaculia bacterium]